MPYVPRLIVLTNARHTHTPALSHRDTPTVTEEELPPLLAAVPAWRLSADRRSIARSFTAKNFKAGERDACVRACAFGVWLGRLCETERDRGRASSGVWPRRVRGGAAAVA
jgi:hypothetical protein